jgi:hypothetical protein
VFLLPGPVGFDLAADAAVLWNGQKFWPTANEKICLESIL